MAALTLSFLGPPQVTRSDGTAVQFRSRKELLLLAYLAVESGRSQSRDSLLGLLWPDMPDAAARNSLRVTLARLRQGLHERGGPFLEASRSSVQFAQMSDHWLDVAAFTALLESSKMHDHPRLETCDVCLERLDRAVAYYRGEFLAGLALPASAALEEWVLPRREALHSQVMDALATLAYQHELRRDGQGCCRYARRQLELAPWHEAAHRQMMRGLALSGERTAALVQFETCRRVLKTELGVEPDDETRATYERIRTGDWDSGTQQSAQVATQANGKISRQPAMRFKQQDWGDVPTTGQVYGRSSEVALVRQWLLDDEARLVAVVGIGGVGKTTLAAAVAHATAGHFDHMIWRSLRNAPPLDDILGAALQTLSGHSLPALPASLDEQLALLLAFLRRYRCLLVLDNLESILQAGQAGMYRPGYERYGQLIRLLLEGTHRSCLLLTSREQPHGLGRAQAAISGVHILRLQGIDAAAGATMLLARGLVGQEAHAVALVGHYSGNPLALQLVAETIQELFLGDIAAFLQTEAPIFDDIRTVLDQQLARLAPLERELLIWLAIEREPATIENLRTNLLRPSALQDVVEALRALQRRSLLETTTRDAASGAAFTLQNVIMEYVTGRLVGDIVREIEEGRPDLLNRHPLLRAQAKEYVRESQARLIIEPIAEQLVARLGREALTAALRSIIGRLQSGVHRVPGYAGGNIVNLLLHLGVDLRGYDFSHLSVWQAFLSGATMPEVNLAECDLSGTVFTGNFSSIAALALSPDGRLLAAGTYAGEIQLWQLADGQPYATLHGHTNTIRSIAFSPNGQLLASASLDHTVRVWEVATGIARHVLHGHGDRVLSVAFNPLGTLLASAGDGQVIQLWDTIGGHLHIALQGHSSSVNSIAFSPDGTLVASGGNDHTVRLWEVSTGHLHKILQGHTEPVACVAFSSDGLLLASGSADRTVRLWEVPTDRSIAVLEGHTNWVRSLAFKPDGTQLASGSADRTVRLWEVPTGQCRAMLHGHANTIWSVAWSSTEAMLASGGDDTIRLWDMSVPGQARAVKTWRTHVAGVNAVLFSPDGTYLVSGDRYGTIRLWNIDAGRDTRLLTGHTKMVNALAFSPDGRLLASASDDETVRVWDMAAGRTVATLQGHRHVVHCVAFSPDGMLLASGGFGGEILLWDLCSERFGQVRTCLETRARAVFALAFSPDGKHLISGESDGRARVWDLGSGRVLRLLEGHVGHVGSIAISPDGAMLATGDASTIYLWDLHHPGYETVVRQLVGHAYLVNFAFSPTGSTLASCDEGRTVRLWDLASGACYQTLQGHTQYVMGVSFSPDGATLASGSLDETIRLWDIGTGACRAVLRVAGPYAGMNITGVTGITEAQKTTLKALGAVEAHEPVIMD